MKDVLILGAGLVAPPAVKELLDQRLSITIAANNPQAAEDMIAGHARAQAASVRVWQSDQLNELSDLIKDHRLVISLLPATMHLIPAQLCLQWKRHLVTTSYVSPEMRALNEAAERAGVIFLNELGLDPGLDHMSAMAMIDQAREEKLKIKSFRSSCGGIPAPEASHNPLRYKFSWSPLGVLRAATAAAKFREGGTVKTLAARDVFAERRDIHFSGGALGQEKFEAYANRDSTSYQTLYGVDQAETFIRETIRYRGWAELMMAFHDLGVFQNKLEDFQTKTFSAEVVAKLEWLDLKSLKGGQVMEELSQLMLSKMAYAAGERDLVLMQHELVVEEEKIIASLVVYGDGTTHSAMAKTVSLPAALGAKLILEEKIKERGVQIPVAATIYKPLLSELEMRGIKLVEKREKIRN